ncbi:MAG: hypothetical protein KGH69_01745 [Candidatus Micrarchaeota archaeon]|nr:hypothetical protein [Candidatus Micrarchaeota archaeon]
MEIGFVSTKKTTTATMIIYASAYMLAIGAPEVMVMPTPISNPIVAAKHTAAKNVINRKLLLFLLNPKSNMK